MSISNLASRIGLVVGASLFALSASAHGAHQMDFDSLKAKCLELSGNQQLKPFKAIITCRDVRYVWREAPSKAQQPFQNAREVGASIRMKGFETPYNGAAVPLAPSQARCAEMEKWKITVPAVDSELSCDELNAIESVTDYCLDAINQRVSDDPSLVIEEATGERVSTCTMANR